MVRVGHGRVAAGVVVGAVAVVLTACGGSSGGHGGSSASPTASAKASSGASTTTAGTVPSGSGRPLSKVWEKKFAEQQGGVGGCQAPSSSECGAAIASTVSFLSDLIDAMGADTLGVAYAKSLGQAQSMADAASDYEAAGCEGDPSADEDGSPCYKDALDVLVGVPILQQDMGIDELNSGVS